jgi:hypothetical protein
LFPLSNSIREGELKGVSKNPASLTQLTPIPSLLKKRGAIVIKIKPLFSLSNSVREGELKGVSKKRERRSESCFIPLFPLSNSIREGELKGVSKNPASLTQLTPIPSLLKKRGAIVIKIKSLFPLSNGVREGE